MVSPKSQISQEKAFYEKGITLIFSLLSNPGLEGSPYTEIAEKADVSMATVHEVLSALQSKGYMLGTTVESRKIADRGKLIEKWAEAYPVYFRPKRELGVFTPKNPDWWQKVDIGKYGGEWSGEIAAAKLTGLHRPATATLYLGDIDIDKVLPILLLSNGLKSDPHGSVEIYEKFWKTETMDIAPPLVIYADLMATGTTENRETGKVILGRYLK